MQRLHRARRSTAALIVGAAFIATVATPGSALSAPLDWAARRQSILYPGPTTGPVLQNLMVGDFDDDGLADVAGTGDGDFWVFPQASGGGTLEEVPSVTDLPDTLHPSFGAAAGDWDADGDLDVALGDSSGVEILLQASGVIGSPTIVPIAAWRMTAAQWDEDTADELVVILPDETGSHLLVMNRADNGTWSSSPIGDLIGPFELEVDDLDADGDMDVVGQVGLTDLAVYLQADDGTLSSDVYEDVSGANPEVGDLTGDGVLDIWTPTGVLPGAGDGTFGTPQTPIVASDAVIADVSGDGLDDLITNCCSDNFAIRFQRAGGVLSAPCDPLGVVPNRAIARAAADLDADGHADIVHVGGSASANLSVAWGSTQGSARISVNNYPNDASWGTSFPITGTVDLVQTCPDAAATGASMELLRSSNGPGGPFDAVATDTADASGAFGFDELPPDIGVFDYQVRFAGGIDNAPTTIAADDVEVHPSADVFDTTLERNRVPYGGGTDFSFTLRPHEIVESLEFDLYREPDGQAKEFWMTVSADPITGTYEGHIANVTRHTTIWAEWDGDPDWDPVSEGLLVRARVLLTGKMKGFYRTDGDYKVFRPNRNPAYLTKVTPVIRDYELITVQRRRNGRWRGLAQDSFRPNADGYLLVVVNANLLRTDVPYRIRARHPGSNRLDAYKTSWSYFKVG